MADFPQRDIELVIRSNVIGNNPKVNNLQNMRERVKHELIVIVDSDIRVEADFLTRIAPQLCHEGLGLVTCFYRAGTAPGIPSTLEAIGITGEFAPGILMADLTRGIDFALGATMALSRKKLDSIGGFPAIADYLADDFMLGNLLWKAGHEIRLMPYVVETMLAPMSFMGMMRHQIRWARAIRGCSPMGHIGSIMTHGVALAIGTALVHGGSGPSILLLGLAVAAQLAMAWTVGVCKLGDKILKKNLWLLPVRDILSFLIWTISLVGRKVEWRGKLFRIVENGKIVLMP